MTRPFGRSIVARLIAAMVWVPALGSSATASAHDAGLERLLLRPDREHGELRGQVTLNPHRTRPDPVAGATAPSANAASAVVALLDRALEIEIDGKPCRAVYEVRELWLPGAPTPGDTVMLRCKLPPSAGQLRVIARAPIDPLVVTVESSRRGDEVEAHSVVIRAGSLTPLYTFAGPPPDWRQGGPNQFDAPSNESAAPPTSTPVPSSGSRQTPGFGRENQLTRARRYFVLGFEHIVPKGLDHLLFVASLVLGGAFAVRRLVWQLSTFTVAHSVTLALASLDWIALPQRVVEPLIGLSIAVVALGNLRSNAAPHARNSVVFGFGLLHGLGFARALSETGTSGGALVVALLSFNVGVELAQLCVVALLLALLAAFARLAPGDIDGRRKRAVRSTSIGIAAIGLFWAIERAFV